MIGQKHKGPKEQGSDGVVPYWSSHLAGAQSELIVHSGHEVIDNSDAMREVIRILHLELHSQQNGPIKKEASENHKAHRAKSTMRSI